MLYFIVVYDIVDDKNRRIVSEILEGYGKRVNRSVFECSVKGVKQLHKLRTALEHEIDDKTDSLRFYPLCANCVEKAWSSSAEPEPFRADAIYFF